MNKAVEDALAVIERAASGNFILAYSQIRNAHATLAAHIAEQDAEIARRQAQQAAVWQYLQSVSPWSESNDMDWADEIICGIDGLRITNAEEAVTEAVATVCLRGDRYGHDNFIEVQLQKAPGVDLPIGTKLYSHPPASGQGDLVEEGLRYFELSGDAGDRRYVAAIRAALTHLPASVAVTEAMEAMEGAAEEIERGHEWITSVGASAIIRKHAAALSQGGQND